MASENTLGYVRPSQVEQIVSAIKSNYAVKIEVEKMAEQTMFRVFIRGRIGIERYAVVKAYFNGFRDASNL